MPDRKTYNRILVLQTAFLGDAILTSPLLEALDTVFPDARIDVLCIPGTADVFNRNPHVHEVLTFRKHNPVIKTLSLPLVLHHLRRRRYDLGISVQSSLTSSLLMLAAGIRTRHGFTRQKLLTMAVPHAKGVHKREKILNLVRPFAENGFSMETHMYWLEPDAARADAVLMELPEGGGPRIGMAPGSIWPTKRWPEDRYRTLVEGCIRAGMRVVLLGGPEDRELCARIAGKTGAVNAAGQLTVPATAALMSSLDLVVCNDSAPLHMADAVGTDVLAVFGPTVKRLGFYPYRERDRVMETDLECRPCGRHGGRKCPLGHWHCMLRITPEQVLETVREMTGAVDAGPVKR